MTWHPRSAVRPISTRSPAHRPLVLSMLCLLLSPTAGCSGVVSVGGDVAGSGDGTGDRVALADSRLSDSDAAPSFDSLPADAPAPDAPAVDSVGKPDTGSKAGFGDPCEDNGGCDSGLCVPSDIGYICSTWCVDDCPEGWGCKAVQDAGPDVLFACLPGMEMVCEIQGVCDPGAEDTQVCGNCGTRSRSCKENCQWTEWSNCFGEGECVAGTSKQEACGNCGTRTNSCTDACLWSGWTGCGSEGACSPGNLESEPCGNCGTQSRTCANDCSWGDWSPCVPGGECSPGGSKEEGCGKCGKRLAFCTGECAWSAWGECSGEGECAVGEKTSQDCGACGKQTRECTSECLWSQWGACEGQGECQAGALQEEVCGSCGKRSRTCGDDCAFGEWSECAGEGECVPGDKAKEPCGKCGERERTCTASCEWSQWGACSGEGDCAPDEMSTAACGNCGTKTRFCAANCSWGPYGDCLGQGECTPGGSKPCDNCGTTSCTAGCSWNACNIGPVDAYEQNDSKGQSYAMLGITDKDSDSSTVTPNINPAYDADWFSIKISDVAFAVIEPKFIITSVPAGQSYTVTVTYDCDMSDKVYTVSKTVVGSATLTLDVGGCYSNIFNDDDSGTAFIEVKPVTSGSCSSYSVKVSA